MKYVKKSKMGYILLLILVLLFITSTNVFASSNYAYVAGIQYNLDNLIPWVDDFDAMDDCVNAIYAYQNAGYTLGGHINPTKEILQNNVNGEVLFFVGHGSTQHINFDKAGLHNRNSGSMYAGSPYGYIDFLGTTASYWDRENLKILVTYSACNTAGEDGIAAEDCISKTTAIQGSIASVGFSDKVHVYYMDDWTNRYNEKLGQGYGVQDAINYANSFSYLLGNEKSNVLWHRSNPNVKIGKYGRSTNNQVIKDKLSITKNSIYGNEFINIPSDSLSMEVKDRTNLLKNSNIEATEENIERELKRIYNNFDKDNYIVQENTSCSIDVLKNEKTNECTYYDYKLKIGDYLTDAAYTVVVVNNKIKSIYDNNVDIEKQEKLLLNEEEFKVKDKINTYELKDKINEADKNSISIVGEKYTYYYDIKNDKKYVILSLETEEVSNVKPGRAIKDYIQEIK